MSDRRVKVLLRAVEVMPPPDRLRLAAALMEELLPDLALALIRRAEKELSAALLLGGKKRAAEKA